MEPIILIGLITLFVWWRRKKKAQKPEIGSSSPSNRGTSGRATDNKTNGDHHPPQPTPQRRQIWGRLSDQIEVEGEFARPDSFKALLGNELGFRTQSGADRAVNLQLVPDPTNPYGANAVAVWCEGWHVGYVPSGKSAELQPVIENIGMSLEVPGRIWARLDGSKVRARAYFHINATSELDPHGNPPTDREALLPDGARMQVIGEENFTSILAPHVPDSGEIMAWLRLKIDYDFRPNSAKKRVNVYLDEEQIGWLSDVQSANMLPLVEYVNERGKVAVAKGVIGGSPLKAEAVLYVARAADVTRDWLNSQGEPTVDGSVKRREFEWDDNE